VYDQQREAEREAERQTRTTGERSYVVAVVDGERDLGYEVCPVAALAGYFPPSRVVFCCFPAW